jgi:endonuclease YncB( thermonuclease family)
MPNVVHLKWWRSTRRCIARREPWRDCLQSAKPILPLVGLVLIAGALATSEVGFASDMSQGKAHRVVAHTRPLSLCTGGNRRARKVTCIVDGDTGWENGVKWRLVGVDAPELTSPGCAREYQLAAKARDRLLQLMRTGYRIEPEGRVGAFRRQLVRIRLSSGRYVGDVLQIEGLAQKWPNTGNVWCLR